ncbi:hypothetical protein QT995_14830 [Microcoleus sp. S36b_A3]|uniref:hypothetical protein n=1 Tax=unclassified Microcoleus TaxID=2642155 RepID=UPI002FD50262
MWNLVAKYILLFVPLWWVGIGAIYYTTSRQDEDKPDRPICSPAQLSCGFFGATFSSFRRIRSDRLSDLVSNLSRNSDELRFVGVVSPI